MSTVMTREEQRQYQHLKRFEARSLTELREQASDLKIQNHYKLKKKELLQAIWRRYN